MSSARHQRWVAAIAVSVAMACNGFAASGQATTQIAGALPPAIQRPAEPHFELTPMQQGDIFLARQRYQAAIEAFKKAPRDSVDAWNKMGVANQLMFNSDEALRCYQRAAKLDPKNASVQNNMGSTYVTLKLYSLAEKSYRRALKLDPKVALFYKNLGTALLAEHKYKKGWAAYQQALAIDPHVFDQNAGFRIQNPSSAQERGAMNFYLAKGCLRAGLKERAIEYLRQALNEGFTNPKKLIEDEEFASLRDDPVFQKMLADQRTP